MPTLSGPHAYTKKDIAKIERVQRQSARFIMADYSYHSSVTNMLTNLKLPRLEHQRTISSLILFYKIMHNLIYIPSSDLIPITSCTRGHHQRFQHIYARTSLYSNLNHFFQEQSEFGTLYLKKPFGNSPYLNSSLNSNHLIITDQLYYLLIIINN